MGAEACRSAMEALSTSLLCLLPLVSFCQAGELRMMSLVGNERYMQANDQELSLLWWRWEVRLALPSHPDAPYRQHRHVRLHSRQHLQESLFQQGGRQPL